MFFLKHVLNNVINGDMGYGLDQMGLLLGLIWQYRSKEVRVTKEVVGRPKGVLPTGGGRPKEATGGGVSRAPAHLFLGHHGAVVWLGAAGRLRRWLRAARACLAPQMECSATSVVQCGIAWCMGMRM